MPTSLFAFAIDFAAQSWLLPTSILCLGNGVVCIAQCYTLSDHTTTTISSSLAITAFCGQEVIMTAKSMLATHLWQGRPPCSCVVRNQVLAPSHGV